MKKRTIWIICGIIILCIAIALIISYKQSSVNDIPTLEASSSTTTILSEPTLSTSMTETSSNNVFVDLPDELFETERLPDKNAVTVIFDGMTLMPGLTVNEIVQNSDWSSTRQGTTLSAGQSSYLVLTSDKWSSAELRLNSDVQALNGKIVVWVHNYDTKDHYLEDCPIYKFKIDCKDCSIVFRKQPLLEYGKYSFGYNGLYEGYEKTPLCSDDIGLYDRYKKGDVDSYYVELDRNDGEGLFAITVFCNEIYGPMFVIEEGDTNG